MKLQNLISQTMIATLLFATVACADAKKSNTEDTDALRKADAAWSASASAENKDVFFSYLLSDVTLLAPHADMANGAEAASAAFKGMFALPKFSLVWKVTSAEVSASGDLGYTYGTYVLNMASAEGDPITDNGKYMTVWKKQADGSWKVAVDMFNTSSPM